MSDLHKHPVVSLGEAVVTLLGHRATELDSGIDAPRNILILRGELKLGRVAR